MGNSGNGYIPISSVTDVYKFLNEGYIITVEIGETTILNIKKVTKLGRVALAIQNYGEYPLDLTLQMLLSRYNVKVGVYQYPPTYEKDKTVEFLIDFWLRRGW